jgi:hypothetical protein
MPTLRDHTKKALADTEPDDAEAKKALDAAVEAPPPQRRILTPIVYCIVAAALVFVIFLRKDPRAQTDSPELTQHAKGVHLYLKGAGEPDSKAMRFDFDTIGARK